MAMTQAATRATAAGSSDASLFAGAGWPLVLFIWAVYAGVTALAGFGTVVDQLSTDDAMRVAEVRDLLLGQSWFDLVQHRLNPPTGVLMHWSRLVDLPIAAVFLAFASVAPIDLAVRLTLTLWPLILLLPALAATASACRTLAGPAAALIGVFMMVLSPGVTTRFAPGAIDHHGAQITLALILLACTLKLGRSTSAALGAGVAAAAMMAIGMETAPHVAACAGMIALRWAVEGDRGMARGAAAFGLTFAGALALIAVATLPPASWAAPFCDALGLGHLVAAGFGGVGLALATRYAGETRAVRCAALAQIGVAVVAGVMLASPECFSAPYAALPEQLRLGWLDTVQEAQNIVAHGRNEPTSALAIGLPLAALIAVAGWAVLTTPHDRIWPVATAAAMCAAAVAVTVWQVRGVGLAFATGGVLLPVAALAIGASGGRARLGLAILGLSPAALALAGLGLASLVGLPAIEDPKAATGGCTAADYRALAARARGGLALNTIDTGPYLLIHTELSAVAAPYHRNVDGLTAALDAFDGSVETARAVAVSRGASFVVACTADGGVTPAARAHPDGFSAALLSGRSPDWLEPVDLGPNAKLRAWRLLAGR